MENLTDAETMDELAIDWGWVIRGRNERGERTGDAR